MSLNTAHASGGVLIYSGERILVFCDGVEMSFEAVGVPHFKGNKKGRIYLTTHRVIFNSKLPKDMLQSFSMPFCSLRGLELEQPVFGANYIKGKVIAEQGGNWTGEAKFKIWFNSGGAIEFGQAMLRAGQLASRNRPPQPQPPPYAPPQGPYYQAPPPAYSPPQSDFYNWVPHQTFPTAPPPEYVYMTEAPPPYPGVDPSAMPYPPPHANGTVGDEKAREAAASAYYNPSNPHNVYMPTAPQDAPPSNVYMPTAPQDAPPSYSEAVKKNN